MTLYLKIIYNVNVSYLLGGYMKSVSSDASKDKALEQVLSDIEKQFG